MARVSRTSGEDSRPVPVLGTAPEQAVPSERRTSGLAITQSLPSPAGQLARMFIGLACLVAAVAVGALTATSPRLALTGAVIAVVVGCVWMWPSLAAYLLIALTPLTAGIDRGLAIPLLRPNEAIAALVGGALVLRWMAGLRAGAIPRPQLSRVEWSMVSMAVTSSAIPLLWMLARGRDITSDDLLYAMTMWKYFALYLIVRASVKTERQTRVCLWGSVVVAAVVGLIAIFQSLGLFGVTGLLDTFYAPFGHVGALQHARGSSTLALPAATADLMMLNLAVVAGLWIRHRRDKGRRLGSDGTGRRAGATARRRNLCSALLVVLAMILVLAALSAGEFSSALGLVVAVVSISLVTRSPSLLTALLPAGVAAGTVLRPVIARRITGFSSASGLPVSWIGRLNNLRTYFWPRIVSDWNFLLGVRPSARVTVATQATGYVWIESGYIWLVWAGGIPFVASFFFFVHSAVRAGWRAARRLPDSRGTAGIAVFAGLMVTSVLIVSIRI